MAEERLSAPIPHYKWTLSTPQDMFDCHQRLLDLGTSQGVLGEVKIRSFPNPQPESVPILGDIVQVLIIATPDASHNWAANINEVVVLVDIVNVVETHTPDSYNAKYGGAQ